MRLLPLAAAMFAPCLFAPCRANAGEPPAAAEARPVPLDRLPGTAALDWEGDLAARMVAGVDRFLLAKLAASVGERERHYQRDFTSPEKYAASLAPNRRRLAHVLGLRDSRVASPAFALDAAVGEPTRLASGAGFEIHAVRWPALDGVHGEGLLLTPTRRAPLARVIVIPDADQTPEALCGLVEADAAGAPPAERQIARRLAETGCVVLVPSLIPRSLERRHNRANLTQREYLYRPAFELGRHIIGYELQKVLAAVDIFERQAQAAIDSTKPDIPSPSSAANAPLAVWGYGEGGMLALYAGALDQRLEVVGVSGYFDERETLWKQPLDRNVFGLLEQFGDAELAALAAPRRLLVEACQGPTVSLPSEGGAPAELASPGLASARREFARATRLLAAAPGLWEGAGDGQPPAEGEAKNIARGELAARARFVVADEGAGRAGSPEALEIFVRWLRPDARPAPPGTRPTFDRAPPDAAARWRRQSVEIDRHTQRLLVESPYVRQEFMKKIDTSSIEKYEQSIAGYRGLFAHEVIGEFADALSPPAPRSRPWRRGEKWVGHEVVLDVFPDVFAYGVLLLPTDLREGEKRPVVVCQHGLEGRPEDVLQGDHPAYHDFAAKLAERGFITFAPQNLYIGKDAFRALQRKANPLKKTLFSVMTAQHRRILEWLASLPQVDAERVAFYGLSYGGKSAMRLPALLPGYCLSICSADFNEWVWKNASTRAPHSYVWTGEYEIFEFDLGSTFNYAEMAHLIAPRPFMVERGHFDGVAPDETVGHEFAKVRHLYAARLKLPARCEIEWFDGPHTIHGQGTFDFLRRHLNWPR